MSFFAKLEEARSQLLKRLMAGEIDEAMYHEQADVITVQLRKLKDEAAAAAEQKHIEKHATKDAVYGYARVSTIEQKDGEGLTRQQTMLAEYAKSAKVELEDVLIDKGKSAYHGVNLSENSALGYFYAQVRAGKIKTPTLVVENVDRLSRRKLADALELMMEMIKTYGVKYHILAEARTYESINMESVLMLSLHIERANAHSKTMSERSTRNWDAVSRDYRPQKILQYKPPGWIRKIYEEDDEGKRKAVGFAFIEENVKAAKLIFELSAKGNGNQAIANRLTELGFKPWGAKRGETDEERAKRMWQPIHIGHVRKCHSAYGDLHTKRGVLKGYYPPIITEKIFNRANKSAKARKITLTKVDDGRPRAIGLGVYIDGTRCNFHSRGWEETKSKGRVFRYYYNGGKGKSANGGQVEQVVYEKLCAYEVPEGEMALFKRPPHPNLIPMLAKMQQLEVTMGNYEDMLALDEDVTFVRDKYLEAAKHYDELKSKTDKIKAKEAEETSFLRARARHIEQLKMTEQTDRHALSVLYAQLVERVEVSIKKEEAGKKTKISKKVKMIHLKGGGFIEC